MRKGLYITAGVAAFGLLLLALGWGFSHLPDTGLHKQEHVGNALSGWGRVALVAAPGMVALLLGWELRYKCAMRAHYELNTGRHARYWLRAQVLVMLAAGVVAALLVAHYGQPKLVPFAVAGGVAGAFAAVLEWTERRGVSLQAIARPERNSFGRSAEEGENRG